MLSGAAAPAQQYNLMLHPPQAPQVAKKAWMFFVKRLYQQAPQPPEQATIVAIVAENPLLQPPLFSILTSLLFSFAEEICVDCLFTSPFFAFILIWPIVSPPSIFCVVMDGFLLLPRGAGVWKMSISCLVSEIYSYPTKYDKCIHFIKF